MSYFRFKDEDIINTRIVAHPQFNVSLRGGQLTGSVELEKRYLDPGLYNRLHQGFSAKLGGLQEKEGPFTASVDIIDAVSGGTNKQLFNSIEQLYNFYAFENSDYTSEFTGSATTDFRVITIPEIYYDRKILSGTFTASDTNNAGDNRNLYDDGRGGIYSGSLTGTLVGNIFYNEGLVVLKGQGLNKASGGSYSVYGDSTDNHKWTVNFKGHHTIPVKIFRCRAPAGTLNASTNESFYTIPTESTEQFKNQRVKILSQSVTYVTAVGIYNDRYELVGMAKLAQPIKKPEETDIQFRIRLDF